MNTAEIIVVGAFALYLAWAIFCTATGRNVFGKKDKNNGEREQ